MPKILVVEDEKNILALVRFNLEREGFQVIATPDGACGLDMAREEKPDLIILDVMLPGMNASKYAGSFSRILPPGIFR
jgi:two-component system alkaline phosphatase synthesis response regulator PhoP